MEKPILTNLLTLVEENKHDINKIKMSYCSLLSQLSECPIVSDQDFYKKIKHIDQIDGTIFILHFNQVSSNDFKIVASGTILIEPKILHNSFAGHIEDIVVDSNYRGYGLARIILDTLKTYALQHRKCYKIILDCKEDLIQFYEKNDFIVKGVQMSKYN